LDIDALRKEYDQRVQEYTRISKFVDSLLDTYKQTSGRNIVRSYASRMKDWESFLRKVEEKGFTGDEIWEKIIDILGFRVMCIFRSELDIIDEWIMNIFEVIEKETYEWGPIPNEKSGEEMKKVVETGYTSIHYTVKLKGVDLSKGYQPLPFEIQTRTLLQDAWSEFNHEIYKSREVPQEVKRSKVILSKYLSAMNDHFESVRDSYLKSRPAEEALKSKNLEAIDLSGKEVMRIDFSGCNLRRAKLVESRFLWCTFDNADLSEADLTKAQLIFAKIRNAKFVNAKLQDADLSYADLTGSNLNFAHMEKSRLSYCDLSNATLRNAKLRYADLSFAVLKQTSLKDSDLRNAHLVYNYYFEEADFEGADLRDALIAKREKLA